MLLAGCWSSSNDVTVEAAPPSATGNIQGSVQAVSFTAAGKPVVTFTLLDQNGAPLDPVALRAEGGRVRFYIARLEADNNYKNYIGSGGNPSYDQTGTFETLGGGSYRYTFSKSIDNASQTLGGIVLTGSTAKTHTVAMQLSRNIIDNLGKAETLVSNPLFNFRPDGGAVTVTREIAATSNCNECHYRIGIHGGTRQEVGLCILCHYPGVVDGNGVSVDMKSMIHKLHMGKNLASNLAGGDYAINGNSFKTMGYPFWSQDSLITRTAADCVKCHKAGKNLAGLPFGRDVDKYKSAPTYDKCTTCHDTLVFTAGVTTIVVDNNGTPATVAAINHADTYGAAVNVAGDNATNPAQCAGCHAVAAFENTDYSVNSVKGAHTILERSSLYTGVNLQIVSVDNAIAGRKPIVNFKITMDNGTVITPASMNSLSFKLGVMPANVADYANANMNAEAQPFSKSATGATLVADGVYTTTFDNALPADATGIGVIGMEGRKAFQLPPSARRGNPASTKNVGGVSAQYYFNVTTGAQVTNTAQQRRVSVDTNKCNGCHGRLSFHGGGRVGVQECVICHNPGAVAGASDFFNLKDMLHMAHTGENLDNSVRTTYFEGRFANMRYPQDRKNCLACHVAKTPVSYGIPLPTGVLPTQIDNTGTLRQAIASACVTCHSDTATIAFTLPHVASQTTGTTELCGQCHTSGLLIGPDFAHQPVRSFPAE
jgi:OmcA/MtrC family decaheme c-type cytochrome